MFRPNSISFRYSTAGLLLIFADSLLLFISLESRKAKVFNEKSQNGEISLFLIRFLKRLSFLKIPQVRFKAQEMTLFETLDGDFKTFFEETLS